MLPGWHCSVHMLQKFTDLEYETLPHHHFHLISQSPTTFFFFFQRSWHFLLEKTFECITITLALPTEINQQNHIIYTYMTDKRWNIIKMWYCEKAQAYKRDYNNFRLCLEEILYLLEYAENNKLLNKRSALISKFRHINGFLLCHLPYDWFQNVFYQYLDCSHFKTIYIYIYIYSKEIRWYENIQICKHTRSLEDDFIYSLNYLLTLNVSDFKCENIKPSPELMNY